MCLTRCLIQGYNRSVSSLSVNDVNTMEPDTNNNPMPDAAPMPGATPAPDMPATGAPAPEESQTPTDTPAAA